MIALSQLDLHLSCLSSGSSPICSDTHATVGSVVRDSIGRVAALQESDNGMFLRTVLSSHRSAAVNTFIDGSRTWTDARVHSKRIDYIAIPSVLAPSVKECLEHDINLSPMVRADHELVASCLSSHLFLSAKIQLMTR